MKAMKVFISSTYEDLKEYRQAAIEVVNRFKCTPLAMEFFGAVPGEPKKVCDSEIDDCDVFVGIYGHRYGFIPDSQPLSITQLEYQLAKKLNKDCLCFLVDKKHPWVPDFIEYEKHKELAAFKEKIEKAETRVFFTTVENFKAQLLEALGKHIAKKNLENRSCSPQDAQDAEGEDRRLRIRATIPVAPARFIAHPYALPAHFTGRVEEQALLSHWLFNEPEPVLVLDAIGGMGKTALTWFWLDKTAPQLRQDTAGVFWWSFYDEPFESFLPALECYVLGQDQRKDSPSTIHIGELLAALYENRFVLVLDGLERMLRGYAGMNAAYIEEKGFGAGYNAAHREWDKRMREPVHPLAGRFLAHLAAPGGKSKTLITSRLMPLPLEGLKAVKAVKLTGLNLNDAVSFLASEGVKGTPFEMEQAANMYERHPLMLKTLASAYRRSFSKDLRDAGRKGLLQQSEPQKILQTMYGLLSEEERKVASTIAVNRGTFEFSLVLSLLPDMEKERLFNLLLELRNLGLVFFDESRGCVDFHPIMRAFLYDQLTGREEIHQRAVQYFQALPEKEKVVRLEDLVPVIELYHHLVKAGKFDEAFGLFRDRLTNPCYFQLSAYTLIIELLKELFPPGQGNKGDEENEGGLPRLKKESDQAWILNTLANSYSLSGQPGKAVPFFFQYVIISEKKDDKQNIAIGLGNVALDQIRIGQLSAGAGHLHKSIALCREIEDVFYEAIGHRELGRVLAYMGRVKTKTDAFADAEEELAEAFRLFKQEDNFQSMGIVTAYRSLAALLQGRLAGLLTGQEKQAAAYTTEALARAHDALAFAEKTAITRYPHPRDFVRAYQLLGEALVIVANIKFAPGELALSDGFDIPFYDDYFQHPIETLNVQPGSELACAERCLLEALRRCRKVNLVEFEPGILLSLARLEAAKISRVSLESFLSDALDIAQRAGYRLYFADAHLLCGQLLVQHPELFADSPTLLGLDAASHLEKAKEFALDVSELSHLYPSSDPDFYKGIPEYEMLKRGMTEEERIRNGYWIAYRCAEELLKILKA